MIITLKYAGPVMYFQYNLVKKDRKITNKICMKKIFALYIALEIELLLGNFPHGIFEDNYNPTQNILFTEKSENLLDIWLT